ncbi:TY-Chap domain-containing protein [Nocardia shimofusensis]|uniref:TY-Chap domain-containing protein n=1 Tax=Nocardia shimofusensis TaxID=228596 RepID=UPI000A86F87D|nr:hypothetical protein [Nocardia shimofusensis]
MKSDITDWPSYSAALTITFARMPSDGCLIVKASGNRFAQFLMTTDGLWTEIVDGSALTDGYRLSTEGEAWLLADGWTPAVEGGSPNWHRELGWPVRYREYEQLADLVVGALHGALGIGSPSEMSVESWVNFSEEGFDDSALR